MWGKYRDCRASFCEAVDVRFWFWYVRKNVRRCVRKHVRRYVRKNGQRYVRKNVRRYVRKNESKDTSERMSEDMPEDMSERCQKEYQKICQKKCQKEKQRIYQKMCQKECQNIDQKERQKIASSQSAKLRVIERISGDELYVYPHLTRSGWHKWMWRENFVIDNMETRWAQSMTFGFGFGVFKRRMLNRGRCITGWCENGILGGAVDAAVSDEAEVLMLKQSVVLQQIGIPYCLEFTPRLLHF